MAKVTCGYTRQADPKCAKYNNLHICNRELNIPDDELRRIRLDRFKSPSDLCKKHKCKCNRVF